MGVDILGHHFNLLWPITIIGALVVFHIASTLEAISRQLGLAIDDLRSIEKRIEQLDDALAEKIELGIDRSSTRDLVADIARSVDRTPREHI